MFVVKNLSCPANVWPEETSLFFPTVHYQISNIKFMPHCVFFKDTSILLYCAWGCLGLGWECWRHISEEVLTDLKLSPSKCHLGQRTQEEIEKVQKSSRDVVTVIKPEEITRIMIIIIVSITIVAKGQFFYTE